MPIFVGFWNNHISSAYYMWTRFFTLKLSLRDYCSAESIFTGKSIPVKYKWKNKLKEINVVTKYNEGRRRNINFVGSWWNLFRDYWSTFDIFDGIFDIPKKIQIWRVFGENSSSIMDSDIRNCSSFGHVWKAWYNARLLKHNFPCKNLLLITFKSP